MPLLAGFGVAALIATIDALSGPGFVLVGLFAIPPLVTATRASPPEVLIVAVCSLALATIAGLWNESLFSADHFAHLLVVIAGCVAAVAIAALRQRLEVANESAELLADAGSLLEDMLDQERALHHIAELAVPAIADAATIELLRDGRIERAATAGVNDELTSGLDRLRGGYSINPSSDHPVAVAIRTGETQHLPNISAQVIRSIARDEEHARELERFKPRAALVVPLRSRGRALGAMAMGVHFGNRGYHDEAVELAEELASRAAVAIDNARLHRDQAQIAEVLQRNLLPPKLAEVPGLRTATRFEAAGEINQVGGDFYDLFASGDRSWMAVIGDVCGKGAEAAAVTALARHTIRAAAAHERQPSQVLEQLSEAMLEERSDLRFCTAALIRLEKRGSGFSITASIGGHQPPLMLRASGKVEALGEPGILIGAVRGGKRRDTEARLSPGDTLLLYTDGLIEGADRSRIDPEWLPRRLTACRDEDEKRIATKLVAGARKRARGRLRDDIAFMLLRVPD